ncbi:hypothetical protein E2C01_000978 [Portunus trituberculatus]|uniref:Uncharacterized protein n=1 Tax=Portunus trituberculatus TaxID=210409 RepID=A0A5B7CFI8_PORTR|nr:hypothetical protein [Portunus trituberculatus]
MNNFHSNWNSGREGRGAPPSVTWSATRHSEAFYFYSPSRRFPTGRLPLGNPHALARSPSRGVRYNEDNKPSFRGASVNAALCVAASEPTRRFGHSLTETLR